MTTYFFPFLGALLMLLTSAQAASQDHHGAGETEHSREAHVHGTAELFVVLEGTSLQIQLRSPAMNLLGFEHEAADAGQRAKVENVRKSLANAAGLFQIDRAHCRLTDHSADFGSVVQEPHAHGREEHRAAHHEHDREPAHSDIEAHYHYQCQRPDEIHSLSTGIRAMFPGIKVLQVQWIVRGRQGAATLDNTRHRVIFR